MRRRPIPPDGWREVLVPMNRWTARALYRKARLQGLSPRELLRRLLDEAVEDLEAAR